MCSPCTPPHATHTPNGPNARSVQSTFACTTMAGEVYTRGAAVFVSAVFSGAATPAHWASATSGIHYACAVLAGRSPSRVHDDAATAGAVAGAALPLSRRRERERKRERERDRECSPGRCAGGPTAPLTQRFRCFARVSVLLAACTRTAWAAWSRSAAEHNLSTCSHTCPSSCRVHGCALCLGLCGCCA